MIRPIKPGTITPQQTQFPTDAERREQGKAEKEAILAQVAKQVEGKTLVFEGRVKDADLYYNIDALKDSPSTSRLQVYDDGTMVHLREEGAHRGPGSIVAYIFPPRFERREKLPQMKNFQEVKASGALLNFRSSAGSDGVRYLEFENGDWPNDGIIEAGVQRKLTEEEMKPSPYAAPFEIQRWVPLGEADPKNGWGNRVPTEGFFANLINIKTGEEKPRLGWAKVVDLRTGKPKN